MQTIRHYLQRAVNDLHVDRHTLLMALVWPDAAINHFARTLLAMSESSGPVSGPGDGNDDSQSQELKQLNVPFAEAGSLHPQLQMLKDRIEHHLSGAVAEVIVHGSYADGTANRYSDVDALVIVRNDALGDFQTIRTLISHLHAAQEHFFAIDPLQHHGWFIIFEQELADYNENVLPVCTLNDGKCLFSKAGFTSDVIVSSDLDNAANFRRLAASLRRKSPGFETQQNAYLYKSLLSEFMLLPTFYMQARLNHPVLKRDSFSLASAELSEWSAMETASRIRSEWTQEISSFWGNPGIRNSVICRKVINWVGPRLPAELTMLHKEITPASVERLLAEMEGRLAL